MTEPVGKPRLDSVLRLYGNGKLPAALLVPITGGGQLYKPAAAQFNAMAAAAKKDGITIRNVSKGYRSYETQVRLFRERYSRLPTLRKPAVKRKWEGHTWWLKKGKAPVATPPENGRGGSNHGWGLAQDINVTNPKTFRWLCANGPRFGFFMEAGPGSPFYERWHWVYCNL